MKSYYRNIEGSELPSPKNPFAGWTEDQIDAHMAKVQYGDFRLTDAVRPSPTLIPEAGYRFNTYHDRETGVKIPVIMAAASREKLFEVFMSFVGQVKGDIVDVVLESSHDEGGIQGRHTDFECSDLDPISLQSNLWDYEDLLTDDGCTSIAVLNPSIPIEVQLEEHKLLIAYGLPKTLRPFQEILEDAGIHRKDDILFVTEDAHIHSSYDAFAERFRALQILLSGDGDF